MRRTKPQELVLPGAVVGKYVTVITDHSDIVHEHAPFYQRIYSLQSFLGTVVGNHGNMIA